MKTPFIIALCFLAGVLSFPSFSQLSVTNGTSLGMTPQQLVQNWLVGANVTISNAIYNGNSFAIPDNQIGTFSALDTAGIQICLSSGVLMTSGMASLAIGPNDDCATTSNNNGPGDPDLDQLAGAPGSTHDRAVIEFDFYPMYDTIKFRYVFASEEFYTYCNSSYNDRFGFFLSGPGISGPFSNNAVNIALMPGSSQFVSINNLCDDTTSNWCNSPLKCIRTNSTPPCQSCVLCDQPRGNGHFIQYNGMTYVFTAWYIVQPCQLYHIKLAIADAGDYRLDSGVFLEKNSFSSPGVQIITNYTNPSLNQGSIEDCNDAVVSFILPNTTPVNDTIHLTIGGTAINGVDYTFINDYVVVPAGEDSTGLIIHPFQDNIPEGLENVVIIAQIPVCLLTLTNYDTIPLIDYVPLSVNTGNDTSICMGNSISLYANTSGGIVPFNYLWNTGFTQQSVTVTPSAGTSQYWVQVSDACLEVNRDTINLSTKPLPAITNSQANYSLCSGSEILIALQSSPPGATFSWFATCSSPLVSGYSNGSGNTIEQTLLNTGILQDTVYYFVRPSLNGCGGPGVVIKVCVIPVLEMSVTPSVQTICSGDTAIISLSSGFPGATFSWTYSQISGNVTGASAGSGNSIEHTLTNIGSLRDSVIYYVTPFVPGCNGLPVQSKVLVDPPIFISHVSCNDPVTHPGARPFKLKGGIPLGGIYSGPGVNSATAEFTPSTAGTGTKSITYSYTDIFGCTATTTFPILVLPVPIFSCGNPMKDVRDNKTYPTVSLGGHCWMAANLDHGTMISWTGHQSDNCVIEKYCFQDQQSNCSSGGLYQWDEMMQYDETHSIQGICPPGWHVPDEIEWNALYADWTNNAFAGAPLKYSGYSGFNALLTGVWHQNTKWDYESHVTFHWSSTFHGSNKAWSHGMNEYDPSVSLYPSLRSNAFLLRCIQD